MESLTPQQIRESFVNCSRADAEELPLPPGMHEVDWSRREYLGWRDPRLPQRGYVVVPTADGPVGIVLKASEASMRSHAPSMCGWCQDVHFTRDVYFWSARRAGQAGRNGDTVGTLVCGGFECSENVRRTPPPQYVGFDPDRVVEDRIAGLAERAGRFAATVVGARI
ncbi:FBP domain-containing protein [Leifsonia sp. NPDC080035]|uniref:FBP domain-containing protein n=1 Tax=Leifsonia sp. NPDC080035 TaxID=3143936 RepID=A0AAU7GAM0_9MICO